MSEEEAIKIIDKSWLFTTNHVLDDENKKFKKAIETVLNMLEEKEKEIEDKKQKIRRLCKESNQLFSESEKKDRQLQEKENRIRNLEKEAQQYFETTIKQDKIIDLMAEKLTNFTATCIDTDGTVTLADKEEVIKYFERKVENEIQEEN